MTREQWSWPGHHPQGTFCYHETLCAALRCRRRKEHPPLLVMQELRWSDSRKMWYLSRKRLTPRRRVSTSEGAGTSST